MGSISKKVWQRPTYFFAFGFGSGLIPVAPGTWGTLVAMPIYWWLARQGLLIYGLSTVIAFILGIYICGKVSRELGEHDYSGIVWDEVVGYLLTMFWAPVDFRWMVLGFVLFRIFDIWKPQPIRYIDQHIQGGLGIMLDDLLAAIPACLIMELLIWTSL
ncbi:MAG: phosphatidylglycerophosphatase A [Legionella sp.]